MLERTFLRVAAPAEGRRAGMSKSGDIENKESMPVLSDVHGYGEIENIGHKV